MSSVDSIFLCGRKYEQCLKDIAAFHGFTAPGVVIGAFIVDYALELLGDVKEADALVETRICLPDAVQIFTPCTFGNGWMKVLDWNKFAVTLYDKHSLNGFRVWLDLDKAKQYPHIYNWYMGLVSKKDLPLEVLLDAIARAGRNILSSRAVKITKYHERRKKGAIKVCPKCGEAYSAGQGDVCLACGGEGYFE